MRTSEVHDKAGPVRRFVRARFAPSGVYGRRLTLGLLVMAFAAGIFALIAANAFTHGALVTSDLAVTQWFQLHSQPALTRVMLYATRLHSNLGIVAMTGAVGFLLYRHGYRFWFLALVSSVLGGMLLNAGLKLLFQRPRPLLDHPLLSLATYSFPSGHTMNATAFYGMLVAFVVMRRRFVCGLGALALAGLMVALVATSRIYLGVHFLSDVLASVAEGIAWIALCLTVLNTYRVNT